MSQVKRDFPKWKVFAKRVAEELDKRDCPSKVTERLLRELKPVYLRCAASDPSTALGPDQILKEILHGFESRLREPGAPGVDTDSQASLA